MVHPPERAEEILDRAFTAAGARRALDRYSVFAAQANWSVRHKIELYVAGANAANRGLAEEDRRRSF
jgi:hypothetical protein